MHDINDRLFTINGQIARGEFDEALSGLEAMLDELERTETEPDLIPLLNGVKTHLLEIKGIVHKARKRLLN